MVMKPAWLEGLISETFFLVCGVHETRRKNGKNIYCLSCCRSICPHCLPSHCSHSLLQVRRYVYQDVVRLDEMKKLIDCSYVQSYIINNAKVVFLNQRPHSRSYKSSPHSCLTCDRILQDPFHFCCISCKVDHVVLQEEDLSSILYRFDDQSDDYAFSQFEELHMDSSNAMEEEDDDDDDDDQMTTSNYSSLGHHQFKASSCSSDLRSNISDVISQESQVVNKKKKSKKKGGSGFFPGLVLSLSNRRKGAPQRSPLL
ncbi:hypothetical protein AQUCO_03000325v1 [Aquilegia coerulea]|uniref:B box-type domain-containing protein n=1 Tax=Aquilegia coerulea TaxID=218851 RepID=A0A2G5D3C2_AQUCA|nr:hypothetical protein AQUCO_03000325v1 [Aquilegia coerulea]